MKAQDKKRLLMGTIIIGIICILMVVLSAYSAELRCDNNDLIASNNSLQGEIDTLSVKIKSANNIQHIESIATSRLGMVYPNEGECVYVNSSDKPQGNFAMEIKEQAYN